MCCDWKANLLLEEHVKPLMKILAGVTHKWEELGIALGMPEAVLEDCRGGGSICSQHTPIIP